MPAPSTIDELGKAFEDFKALNETKLGEIAKTGEASAAAKAAVDKANADITAIQSKLKADNESAEKRMNELEDRINRNATRKRGEKLDDDFVEQRAAWQSMVQGKVIDPADVDHELINNYSKAARNYLRNGGSAEDRRILDEMSAGSDQDGGYFVSPDTSGRVMTFLRETSPIRQHASVQSISSDRLEGDVDLDEAASGGWVGETTAPTQTGTPQVGRWAIDAHEQYAEPRATQRLLDDAAINVESWLAGKVSSKLARVENSAFVLGNGVSKPRGFTTHTAGTPGATAATFQRIQQVVSGHATALTADGLNNLVYSLKSGLRSGAIFAGTRLTEAAIRAMKDGDGNYLWRPDFSQAGASTLMGFPFVEFADMPEVEAGALALVFGNLREGYQIVDRLGIRTLRDPFTSKPYVKFYTTKRSGGDVVNFEALKLQKVAAA